jgi:hypothetical protein
VVEAAAGGLLDESHWIDLKQELPPGKRTHNTELAQDLASLAVDGGLLVIGIEDHNSYAGKVCGVPLAGLADRVDQVARDKVRPSLVVRSREIPDPSRPGWGCLLVHVPPSAQAPHMVDHVCYGRSDRANMKLGHEDVRRIIEERSLGRLDVIAELRQMADDDPIRAHERELGHLYVLAQPEVSSEDMFLDLLTRADAMAVLLEIIGQIRGEQTTLFVPDTDYLHNRIQRAEGVALTSYSPEDGPREQALMDLVIREDGGIRFIFGRGTDPTSRAGLWPEGRPQMAIVASRLLGLTRSVAALAGRLADEFGAYQGQWRLGVRMDRLLDAVPADIRDSPFGGPGNAYSRDDYEKVTTASTEELANAPHAVAERLVGQLLRGLGIAQKYLPYEP